ncbi:hypothetical protein BAUCODRAFT_126325 [Baudoinia panamericana UAMH 10762]|uniref:CNH domain-containing protein n=1 Tax=Baudoinia panamericana (strain UAMH 10762) TaxID=717646 RepID=M2M7N2_BAUPA|nr:uncharacterized protein BAUCODRAFT_126325 [Baudoinia panamericana UAMH 10762]EMC92336.1 hypothetical protein BAUCODRAFT_126325 [Baudoinia panamericana UAMH 10762]
MEAPNGSSHATVSGQDRSAGPYVLRELIKDIPLGEHKDGTRSHITCVDTWNGNLYVGTSAGEVLHYVAIPPDPTDESGQASYIFATKLEPPFNTEQEGLDAGVKQILLLPVANKACILCNGTLTFYTLPELSPAFGGKIRQPSCLWIGGIDTTEQNHGGNAAYGTVVVICLRQRLRLIRIGDEARKIRDIELGGVSAIQRIQDLACVADGHDYSLLDVVNQRKNNLFPISSQATPEAPPSEPDRPPARAREPSRSFSSASPVRLGRAHERNTSLGAESSDNGHLRPGSSSPWPSRRSSRLIESAVPPGSREGSPEKPSPETVSARTSTEAAREPEAPVRPLPPNILSPTANEFLLTTGTKMNEPGVGMFVNLDGDVVRGTIEFSTYPQSLVLDGVQTAADSATESERQSSPGYVLALVQRKSGGKSVPAIEAQRWDVDASDARTGKQWLDVPLNHTEAGFEDQQRGVGLRTASDAVELAIPEIGSSLRLRRILLTSRMEVSSDSDLKREQEEDDFASSFAQASARVLLYYEDRISWVMRSALIVQLEQQLNASTQQLNDSAIAIEVPSVQRVVNSIRGQNAANELEFLTLTYVRQKTSLLLFGNLLLQTAQNLTCPERDKRFAEEALVAGEIDPRTILGLVPPLAEEVTAGEQGIWIAQGLQDTLNTLHRALRDAKIVPNVAGAYGDNLLPLLKRYLLAWRKKKGFGSIADETHVFRSVDAALTHVLLMLDQHSPRGPALPGTLRAELNEVVDRGVDCFDRAVQLFEEYHRLYMLSRLYQSRKMTGHVLATWRRIVEGEHDAGGELIEGEQDIRRYLTKLRDANLVEEYGTWLANRNPKLGVQVFADDSSRVKFQPQEAVSVLKRKAPGAVKDYLEHLVFGKNHVQYVNDLIAFYLDTVLTQLERSEEARQILLQSYETYRALKPPKPTYRQFITDNAVDADWWHNRLRLLQLIGGSHGAAQKYDVHTLGQRLAPHSDELVPEMIILNGREGKHEEALRLLTHGLGDFDTAIRYCLLGGSSIFHSAGASALAPETLLPTREEQARLFNILLHQFLRIEDATERLERTAELLERFGGWFDLEQALELIPLDWSVEQVSGFLVHALRRLVRDRNESIVVKALSSAQNLRRAVEYAEKTEVISPVVARTEVEAG